MMAQAAVSLGVPIRLLAEGPDVSAAQVVRDPIVGDYRDLDTLRTVAEGCSVVTFDHEHVPTEHLHTLASEGHACRPVRCAGSASSSRSRSAGTEGLGRHRSAL